MPAPRWRATAVLSAERAASAAPAESIALRLATFTALASFAAAHWAGLVGDPPGGPHAARGGRGGGRRRGAGGARPGPAPAPCRARGVRRRGPSDPAAGPAGRRPSPAPGLARGAGASSGTASTAAWRACRAPTGPTAGPTSGSGSRSCWAPRCCWPCPPCSPSSRWPAGARFLRMGALVLLLVLYGTAVTEHDPGAAASARPGAAGAGGAPGCGCPRLAPREALGAAGVVAAVGLLSVPVAASLDADQPWWNYRDWELFGNGQAVTFDWTHTYGPLDWPRNGTTLLNIKSDRAHYWKVETLDGFDGFRWLRTPTAARAASFRAPARPRSRGPELELLRVQQALGLAVPRDRALALERPDRRRGHHLRGGRRRRGVGIGPTAPRSASADRRSSAATRTPCGPTRPIPRRRRCARLPATARPRCSSTPTWCSRGGARAPSTPARARVPAAARRSRCRCVTGTRPPTRTPRGCSRRRRYGRTYRLASRITAGQPTTYDAVKAMEDYLQRNYRYSERPPSTALPLDAFLFDDRIGYCQQFSGAMALMLRLEGIPARVAAGFSPGSYNRDTGEYRVRDLDAHSWVEVWFNGIGWVPFDPTPAAAPAESQASGLDGGERGRRRRGRGPLPQPGRRALASGPGAPAPVRPTRRGRPSLVGPAGRCRPRPGWRYAAWRTLRRRRRLADGDLRGGAARRAPRRARCASASPFRRPPRCWRSSAAWHAAAGPRPPATPPGCGPTATTPAGPGGPARVGSPRPAPRAHRTRRAPCPRSADCAPFRPQDRGRFSPL